MGIEIRIIADSDASRKARVRFFINQKGRSVIGRLGVVFLLLATGGVTLFRLRCCELRSTMIGLPVHEIIGEFE